MLAILRSEGALSRAELCRKTGLSRTTLSETTAQLLARGAVIVADTDSATRRGSGRPAERLVLDPAAGQFLGIDFGHQRVQVAIADASHTVIADGLQRYPDGTDWNRRIALALALVDRVSNDHAIHLAALQAIGIGVPGPYRDTRTTGPTVASQGQSTPEGVDRTFAERFGTPVLVDNNTRLAALAEAVSETGPPTDLIYVRLSDGVGGGLVVSGRLVTGASGYAGEIGHVTAVPDGVSCRCGKRGCLETIASVSAILAYCRSHQTPVHTLADLASAVSRQDPGVKQALREVGRTLGHVLGTASMVLNPDEVVIGGEVVHAAPDLLEHAASALQEELFPVADSMPMPVRAGRLRDDDGALGALAAVFRRSSLLAAYTDDPAPTQR